MKVEQIAKPPIEPHLPPEVQYLRHHAPEFIKALVEKSYLFIESRTLEAFDPADFTTLKAGTRSAVFFVRKGPSLRDFLVIKFRYQGVMAEYESLQAWQAVGVNTIDVLSAGLVKTARPLRHRVRYLISRGVTNGRGEPAETCFEYAQRHAESVRSVGYALGRELAKLHRASSSRSFGEFADMWNNPGRLASWPKYLLGHIRANRSTLEASGISAKEIARLKAVIRTTEYPSQGIYVHGDYSMRNALIERERPLKVRIFDPNPLIGHSSWDLAVFFNNSEFERRKALLQPNNRSYQAAFKREQDCLEGCIESYQDATGRRLDMMRIHQAQLIQMIFLLAIKRHKLKFGAEPEIEVTVREQALREMLWRVLQGE